MSKPIFKVIVSLVPVFLMIALIPLIQNDYILTALDLVIIAIGIVAYHESKDLFFLIYGFIIMTIVEFVYIKTGVVIYTRQSFFNFMPLWLPVLWAYGFVVGRRAISLLNTL